MANKYCNLDGSKKIKDEYQKINIGFDKVEEDVNKINDDINALDERVDTIITTPVEDVSAEEIIDARGGNPTLGKRFENIETAIEELDEVKDELDAHKAESVSQSIVVQRDVSITGTQRIETNKKPKLIIVTSSVNGTKKMSVGSYSENSIQRCLYTVGATENFVTGGFAIIVADTTENRTFGQIINVTKTGFDINWIHSGSGATGTVELTITILYHGE